MRTLTHRLIHTFMHVAFQSAPSHSVPVHCVIFYYVKLRFITVHVHDIANTCLFDKYMFMFVYVQYHCTHLHACLCAAARKYVRQDAR